MKACSSSRAMADRAIGEAIKALQVRARMIRAALRSPAPNPRRGLRIQLRVANRLLRQVQALRKKPDEVMLAFLRKLIRDLK